MLLLNLVRMIRVYCHKMILVARSPFFNSMLMGGMMESKSEVIEIHDVSRDAFLEVINMIYAGRLALNHENVYELLQASEYTVYQLKGSKLWKILLMMRQQSTYCHHEL